MGTYLNPNNESFLKLVNSGKYVDKTGLIDLLNHRIDIPDDNFICINRPRRFGKSIAEDMISAYYSKGADSENMLLVVANFAGKEQEITTGVPLNGNYKEIINTDDKKYGGSGLVNSNILVARAREWDDKPYSVKVKVAAQSASILKFVPYVEEKFEK